jgi:hypothetical protein
MSGQPVAMVPVEITYRTKDGATAHATVYGEPTANEHLVITPLSHDGELTGGFALTHAPTGLALLSGGPAMLREVSQRLAHFDWRGVTADNFRESDIAREARKVIQELQFTDPSAVELPAHDTWGPDGKGRGLKRAAVPSALDILADFQKANQKTFGEDAVPPTLTDPGSPTGTKLNPEWSFWIFRKVQNYGLAYLLLVLHQIDHEVADSAAAFLADSWESGDSIEEWAWEWHQALVKGETPDLPGIPHLGELFMS